MKLEVPTDSIQVLRKFALVGTAATALVLFAAPAQAQIVQNGGFESTTNGAGQLGYNTAATDWSVSPVTPGGDTYIFLFNAGTADTTGANGEYGGLTLWGPGDGSNNGLPAASPDGGNFVAMDGDFQNSYLTQTINGLTPGDQYAISFYWAASQQSGFYGDTIQSLTVSLGSESQTTTAYDLPSQGFSGWMAQTDTFTASSGSEALSFLANGNLPVPPFVLLDGVSGTQVSSVPEGGATSMYLLLAAALSFGALFIVQRKRLGAKAE